MTDEDYFAHTCHLGFEARAESRGDHEAIREFQALARLPQSGALDDATKTAISRVLESGRLGEDLTDA
jgi:hypothetical protein